MTAVKIHFQHWPCMQYLPQNHIFSVLEFHIKPDKIHLPSRFPHWFFSIPLSNFQSPTAPSLPHTVFLNRDYGVVPNQAAGLGFAPSAIHSARTHMPINIRIQSLFCIFASCRFWCYDIMDLIKKLFGEKSKILCHESMSHSSKAHVDGVIIWPLIIVCCYMILFRSQMIDYDSTTYYNKVWTSCNDRVSSVGICICVLVLGICFWGCVLSFFVWNLLFLFASLHSCCQL